MLRFSGGTQNKLLPVLIALYLAAATFFVMSGLMIESKILPYPQRYSEGREKAPYQNRILMIPVERLAYHSQTLARVASHRIGPFRDPGNYPVAVLGFLSIIGSGLLALNLYWKTTAKGSLGWLIYPAILMAVVATYTLHVVSNNLSLYDLPSMFLFTLGVWLAWERKFWWLVLLFPIATLNRETSLFLIPVAILMQKDDDTARLPEKRPLHRLEQFSQIVLMAVMWVVITRLEKHYFPGVGSDETYTPLNNLRIMKNPVYWPNMLAATGFLWVIPAFGWRRIHNPRFRSLLLIFPLWLAVMLFRGGLSESRVFTELIPLTAVMAALVLEEPSLSTSPHQTLRTNKA